MTLHCPNTGRMLGCAAPGMRVWLSRSDAAQRKLAHTWELSATPQALVGVHPGRANALVAEAIDAGLEEIFIHLMAQSPDNMA